LGSGFDTCPNEFASDFFDDGYEFCNNVNLHIVPGYGDSCTGTIPCKKYECHPDGKFERDWIEDPIICALGNFPSGFHDVPHGKVNSCFEKPSIKVPVTFTLSQFEEIIKEKAPHLKDHLNIQNLEKDFPRPFIHLKEMEDFITNKMEDFITNKKI